MATCLDAQESGVDQEVAALIKHCIGGECRVNGLKLPLLSHTAAKVDRLQFEHVRVTPLQLVCSFQ